MSKHHSAVNGQGNMYKPSIDPSGFWHCPVELVSAETEDNVGTVWDHALKFREVMGEDYLMQRR